MVKPGDPLAAPRVIMRLGQGGAMGQVRLGHYNNVTAQAGLLSHSHSDAIEICFLVKGRQTYRVQGEDFRMRGGDVFLTFPNESHDTGGSPQEKGMLYWLILQMPKRGAGFLGLASGQAQALAAELRRLKVRHFRGTWTMKTLLDEIVHVVHDTPACPLRETLIANRLCAFVLEVISCAHEAGATTEGPLRPVLDYIEKNLSESLQVPDLAERAGLSVSRFKARFKAEIGVPPAEYVLRAKVEEARRRLERGKTTVTDTAFDLGFSSSQYFATVFKRFTGKRPMEVMG